MAIVAALAVAAVIDAVAPATAVISVAPAIPAVIAAAVIDGSAVTDIIVAGVDRGDIADPAVANRLAARERDSERRGGRAKENPIANHGPSPLPQRSRPTATRPDSPRPAAQPPRLT